VSGGRASREKEGEPQLTRGRVTRRAEKRERRALSEGELKRSSARPTSSRGQEQGRQPSELLLELLLVFTRKRGEGVGRERKRGGDLNSGVGVIKRLMLSSNTANTSNREARRSGSRLVSRTSRKVRGELSLEVRD
jgi:hypothetical protein